MIRRHLFQPGLQNRFVDRNLLKQHFGGLDLGMLVKPLLDNVITQRIGDRQQRYSQVMRHPLPHQDGPREETE